jgi:hypothetical protein
MRALSPRRLTTRARFAAASLSAAGALSLLLPAVAAASTGHGGGGGGLLVAVPVGSIFSDILGGISGFGKDIVSTIFKSVLSLMFGNSWKFLLHPYDIVEWLIGLPGTGNTTAFVPFANNGAGPFAALCKDTQAIGLGLLPLALANNTLHLISGGIFSKPRDHMHDFGKVFTAAVVIIIWPWLFGQAIDLANTVTLAMLQAANANGNLWKTLAAYFALAWGAGALDLLTAAFLIATVVLLVGLIVMKIILMVALAFLLVVGPIAVAFYPFEFLSRILMLFGTVFLALAMVPLGWAVLFALFTAFGASVFGFSNFIHAGLLGGSMKDIFDLICSLVCFYLAWKWPFLIIGRLTSIIGGNVAAAGEALSSLGRGGASAGAAAAGGGSAGGAAAAGAEGGGRLAGALQGIGGFAQGLGGAAGGAVAGLTGTTPAQFAGYGLGAKGMNGMRAASSALRRNGGAGGGASSPGAQAGDPGSGQPVSPVGTAVANGPDAGFDAVRASGKNFSAGADALATGSAALSGVGVGSGAAGAVGGGAPTAVASKQSLARDAALSAALTSSRGGPVLPGHASGATTGSGGGGTGDSGAGDGSAQIRAGLAGTSSAPTGSSQPASPAPAASPASPASPQTGAVAAGDSDPRQVLQASAATASAPAASVRSGAEPSAAPPSPARLAAPSSSSASTPSASPGAARPGATGGSSSGHAGGGGHTPPPSSHPGPARASQRNGSHTPPPVGASPDVRTERTSAGEGRSQSSEHPPAPVSPPANR